MELLMRYLLLICTLNAGLAQEDPIVSTIYGDIRGSSRETAAGNTYNEFKGIPFARPPVGELRWQKPVAPEPWDEVRDAKTFGRICTQAGAFTASEDCLFLNVYVSGSVKERVSKDENLPVLFFVHGGAFIFGSSNGYNGALLATTGQVIVVTTNYRLSTLGFFSSQSDAAPGNYGLWDQIAALEWVRDNIAAFGGDVSRVTIMGHSAGSASVSHLALSPAAKGLFQRAIFLSGSAASYFGATSHQRLTSARLASHFNCPTGSDEEAIDCLRGESAFSLDLLGLVYPPLSDGYLCTQIPVIDGELAAIKPIDAMEAGMNSDFDLMAGLTMHDGAPFALPFTLSPEIVNFYVNAMFYAFQNKDELVALGLERFPDVLSEDYDTRRRALTKVATDFVFGSRALKEIELHSRTSSRGSYLYEFRHQYSSTNPEWLQGVHGEDVGFIFGRESFQGEDAQLSAYMQAYYCNFVHTGNPNEGPHAVPVEWPQFDPSVNARLVESPEPFVETIPEDLQADLAFWNHIYDIIIPRVDFDLHKSSYNPKMLEMWNTLVKEIQKVTDMTTE